MKKITEIEAAKIGLIALIDEVTGYQEVRPANTLRKMMRGKEKAEPAGTEWAKEQTQIVRERIRETGRRRAEAKPET